MGDHTPALKNFVERTDRRPIAPVVAGKGSDSEKQKSRDLHEQRRYVRGEGYMKCMFGTVIVWADPRGMTVPDERRCLDGKH